MRCDFWDLRTGGHRTCGQTGSKGRDPEWPPCRQAMVRDFIPSIVGVTTEVWPGHVTGHQGERHPWCWDQTTQPAAAGQQRARPCLLDRGLPLQGCRLAGPVCSTGLARAGRQLLAFPGLLSLCHLSSHAALRTVFVTWNSERGLAQCLACTVLTGRPEPRRLRRLPSSSPPTRGLVPQC